jgi:hypothetical protein
MTYPTLPEDPPAPPPAVPDVQVRMLFDLGGYTKGAVILVPADIADAYVAAGYVKRVRTT